MSIEYLERKNAPRLAYRKFEGNSALPAVIFCGGFRSDMEGTKAQYLEDLCRRRGQSYVRFDYSAHGSSDGDFADGTIGGWKDDTLAVIDELTEGPVIIVGSSMGGWIALLAAMERPDRVAGLIGLAAAPDFTQEIYEERLSDEQRAAIEKDGFADIPNDYSDEPYLITKKLIDDGNEYMLLDREIPLEIPMRLIQGMEDADVPWQKAYRIKNALADDSRAEVLLIESGDHRLSRPEDLDLLGQQVMALSEM